MSIRRVSILLRKEFGQGTKNFIFIFAVVTPLAMSLIISLLFGTLFTDTPKFGISDEGSSRFVTMAAAMESLIVREYPSVDELKQAVAAGSVDIGMVLPLGFDDQVVRGERVELSAFIWGESLAKNRAIVGAAIASIIRDLAGQEAPVEIVTTTLGDGESIPLNERLVPFVVLMAVVIGGVMVPASSLVEEKQKKTLGALVATPTTVGDVFVAKGLLGAGVSLLMGIVILILNQAFGTQPLLLTLVLALGAILAAVFGVLLGAFVKDISTLFATIKAIGLILYAPALLNIFPDVPEWIAKIFPTYYIIAPVVRISQRGEGWPEIAAEVLVLVALIVVMIGVTAIVAGRTRQSEAQA